MTLGNILSIAVILIPIGVLSRATRSPLTRQRSDNDFAPRAASLARSRLAAIGER
jgi:hypothetical protein